MKNHLAVAVRRGCAAVLAGTVVLSVAVNVAAAPFTSYSNRTVFEAGLAVKIVDDYSNAGYQNGDISNSPTFDRFSNAAMNAVLGETTYFTTGFANNNLIHSQGANRAYCAGCNGSFDLGFGTTSLSVGGGVYGVGLNFVNTDASNLYHAFVRFADSSTQDFLLSLTPNFTSYLFFGITSATGISSISLGLANGGTTQGGAFSMDNLTIGTQSQAPEPATVLLIGLGALGLGWSRRKRA